MWDIGGIPIVERNHGLVVSQFLFTTLAVLAVCLRLFTRGALVRNLGLDDYFASFAMVGAFYNPVTCSRYKEKSLTWGAAWNNWLLDSNVVS